MCEIVIYQIPINENIKIIISYEAMFTDNMKYDNTHIAWRCLHDKVCECCSNVILICEMCQPSRSLGDGVAKVM